MIWLVIGLLLFFALGAFLNYTGVALMVEAFAFSGGDAIGTFLLGCFVVLLGCGCYILHTLLWHITINEIQECLKE